MRNFVSLPVYDHEAAAFVRSNLNWTRVEKLDARHLPGHGVVTRLIMQGGNQYLVNLSCREVAGRIEKAQRAKEDAVNRAASR